MPVTKKAAKPKAEKKPKHPILKNKLPEGLAQCADLLYESRETRLVLQKVPKAIEEQEKKLKNYLIDNLPKSKADGITGKKAHAEIKKEEVPSVKNWDELFAWIKKGNGVERFAVLGRTIKAEAIQELWDDKKVVPGVETFTVIKVSCTKK